MPTRPPSPAMSRAVAAPIPRAPPVTNATFPSRRPTSDPQAVGQPAAVRRGVAEQEIGGLGAPEVQVCVVLPREPDPAVHLDVVAGAREEGLPAERLGQRR